MLVSLSSTGVIAMPAAKPLIFPGTKTQIFPMPRHPKTPMVFMAGRFALMADDLTLASETIEDNTIPVIGCISQTDPSANFVCWAEGGRVSARIEKTTKSLRLVLDPDKEFPAERILLLRGSPLDSPAYRACLSSRWRLLGMQTDYLIASAALANNRRVDGAVLTRENAVMQPGLDPAIVAEYNKTWIRGAAHLWHGLLPIAGPEFERVFLSQIDYFANAPRGPYGQPPTKSKHAFYPTNYSTDVWTYGNMDSAAYLIWMGWDYWAKTGDESFVRRFAPQARSLGKAIITEMILANPRKSGLAFVPTGGDTYIDLALIKGEQTYLNVVCWAALCKAADLLDGSDTPTAQEFRAAASRIKTAANKDIAAGGLWDKKAGSFVGWRWEDGKVAQSEEIFGSLIAASSGFVTKERARSICRRIDINWKNVYEQGLSPTAHAIGGYNYPNINFHLNQSCPWVAGWDICARSLADSRGAEKVFTLLALDGALTDYPFREASSPGETKRDSGNRGRAWDSWSYFFAIFRVHYGLIMTPRFLEIDPHPLIATGNDFIHSVRWQGHTYNITYLGMKPGARVYKVLVDGKLWTGFRLPRRNCLVTVIMKGGG